MKTYLVELKIPVCISATVRVRGETEESARRNAVRRAAVLIEDSLESQRLRTDEQLSMPYAIEAEVVEFEEVDENLMGSRLMPNRWNGDESEKRETYEAQRSEALACGQEFPPFDEWLDPTLSRRRAEERVRMEMAAEDGEEFGYEEEDE